MTVRFCNDIEGIEHGSSYDDSRSEEEYYEEDEEIEGEIEDDEAGLS